MGASKPPRLVEGIDFYMEGDNVVFTSTYLLKRGYCCNSGCRHCPYGDKAPKLAVNVVGVDGEPEGS